MCGTRSSGSLELLRLNMTPNPVLELKQAVKERKRRPDFSNILKICRREKPSRPTLFEFILNDPLLEAFLERHAPVPGDWLGRCRFQIDGFAAAGFDCAVIGAWCLNLAEFPTGPVEQKASKSLNEGGLIKDWESFEKYRWPDPEANDFSPIEEAARQMPEGMKLILSGYGGVLETAISLTGYEQLCYLLFEEPDLVEAIFENIGRRILRYYQRCAPMESVGALIANDDWGFKTQTMISPADLNRYVFPWYQRIADMAHQAGKPVLLHSCGNLAKVMDTVIDFLKIDAKHSFEDAILPVEEAYRKWGDRIAIMGGLDVDFLGRKTPGEIRLRTQKLIELSSRRGGLAIGSGNSIPEYIPVENFCAMAHATILSGA
jgi:uroporphyrinogen decarboxylase